VFSTIYDLFADLFRLILALETLFDYSINYFLGFVFGFSVLHSTIPISNTSFFLLVTGIFLGSDLKPNQGIIALVDVDKLLNTAKT